MPLDAMMTGNIHEWETVETRRSADEAERRGSEDLRIDDNTLARYTNPPAATVYPLEYSYHLLGDVTGQTVLDYGCGMGENSLLIARHGGTVKGIDISQDLIDLAERRMDLHGFGGKAEFIVGSAHDIPLPDESVDVVFGMAILHHLDLELSAKEVHRVLKKGGRAIFQEPVRNSKMMWFLRSLVPYQQPDISPFERPLSDRELRKFAKDFSGYKSRAFALPYVGLAEMTPFYEKIIHPIYRMDGKILKAMPFLNHFATIRVVEMVK